jgi:DNA-binding GntR family transcriptional regulator
MPITNKAVESVLAELRDGMQRGRYAPAQRLLTSDLAAQMGTSLAPVREALHILAGEGLVELQPNKGARVRPLTKRSFIDGLQVLDAMGCLALRLIAPRLSDPVIREEIAAAVKKVLDAGEARNTHEFFMAIGASHRLVNEHAGNSYLNPILNRIHLEYFYRQMADYLPNDFWQRYTDNYRVTGGLLVAGDVKGAEKAWSRHVQWVIATIQRSELG